LRSVASASHTLRQDYTQFPHEKVHFVRRVFLGRRVTFPLAPSEVKAEAIEGEVGAERVNHGTCAVDKCGRETMLVQRELRGRRGRGHHSCRLEECPASSSPLPPWEEIALPCRSLSPRLVTPPTTGWHVRDKIRNSRVCAGVFATRRGREEIQSRHRTIATTRKGLSSFAGARPRRSHLLRVRRCGKTARCDVVPWFLEAQKDYFKRAVETRLRCVASTPTLHDASTRHATLRRRPWVRAALWVTVRHRASLLR